MIQLIDYIRTLAPSHYWSAGFMAWLVLVIIASFLLFVITHWRGWLVAMVARDGGGVVDAKTRVG